MKNKNNSSQGIAIGLAIGTAIGIATDNLATWIAIGLVFVAGIGSRIAKKKNK